MLVRIALIHAVTVAMQPVAEAFAESWPEAQLVNLLDDSLALDRGNGAEVPAELFSRFRALVAYADAIGARGVLFTCSAFGPAIDAAAGATRVPVLKPNEAMFEAALARGRMIGMLSSFAPANAPMEQEFRALSEARDTPVQLRTVTVPDAMVALRAGDVEAHNSMLANAAGDLSDCDAIMLAQFSASRARAAVQARVDVPVLTSPASAVAKLKDVLLSPK